MVACCKCHKAIEDGTIVTALNQKWHQQCFTCQECDNAIIGTFSTSEGHPYCIKCFAKVNLSDSLKCAKCHQSLDHEKTCVKALGAIYHDQCFICNSCHQAIGATSFNTKERMPYCDRCFKSVCESTDGRCAKCNKVMDHGVVVTALEKKWHKACFLCSGCDCEIGNKTFNVHEDKAYCARCYTSKFASKCKKCRRVIEPGVQFITYEKDSFHKDCFICMKCRKSLAGKKFVMKNDHHYCVEHA